ncbi:oxidoreductase [Clostridia bacterium]|nr:oxidoreductase [Clostridia bacterium]
MKKVIILGATSGIGRELALLYAKKGAKAAIAGRRLRILEEMKGICPEFIIKQIDVTKTTSLAEKLTETARELNGLDLLIISAGVGYLNATLDFSVEKRAIDTNVLGYTCACDWAMNYFKNQGSGHLVGISSIVGLRGSKVYPAYSASKAYQMTYLEALRQKVSKWNIPVYITDIRPGYVDTAMAKGEVVFWVSPVKKAVRQIFRAIEDKKDIAYITRRWGAVAFILKHLPRALYEQM